MKRMVLAGLLFLFAALSVPAAAAGDSAKLDRVLRKLNQLNKVLRTFQADIIQRKYLNIIQEYDELEKGKFYFKKEVGASTTRSFIWPTGICLSGGWAQAAWALTMGSPLFGPFPITRAF